MQVVIMMTKILNCHVWEESAGDCVWRGSRR